MLIKLICQTQSVLAKAIEMLQLMLWKHALQVSKHKLSKLKIIISQDFILKTDKLSNASMEVMIPNAAHIIIQETQEKTISLLISLEVPKL